MRKLKGHVQYIEESKLIKPSRKTVCGKKYNQRNFELLKVTPVFYIFVGLNFIWFGNLPLFIGTKFCN